MIELLLLILGLLLGFYARTILNYLKRIYEMVSYKHEAKQTGVVKPEVAKVAAARPIDLSTKSGVVRQLNPDEVLMQRMKQREERLQSR